MTDMSKDMNLQCAEPLSDIWDVKSGAGNWAIDLPCNFAITSVQERNSWYAETMISTVDAFASLARVYQVSFGPIPSNETKVKGQSLEWKLDEPYDCFLAKTAKAIKEYPVDIYALTLKVDLFVYVHTKESPNKAVRVWVRKFGNSIAMGEFEISLDHSKYKENYVYFDLTHTLFYPFSYIGYKDNQELFNLNQPLLAEALRKWEKKFDAEIEPDGLPGIYKYGYLPEDQW